MICSSAAPVTTYACLLLMQNVVGILNMPRRVARQVVDISSLISHARRGQGPTEQEYLPSSISRSSCAPLCASVLPGRRTEEHITKRKITAVAARRERTTVARAGRGIDSECAGGLSAFTKSSPPGGRALDSADAVSPALGRAREAWTASKSPHKTEKREIKGNIVTKTTSRPKNYAIKPEECDFCKILQETTPPDTVSPVDDSVDTPVGSMRTSPELASALFLIDLN